MTRKRATLALSVILIALVALLAAGSARADAATVATRAAASDGGARGYWTRARMRSAEPVGAVLGRHLRHTAVDHNDGAPSYVPPASAGAAKLRSGFVSFGHGRILGSNRDEVTEPAAPEFAAHGKVFFTIPKGPEANDYVCSGTAVNSRNRSLVWTAGHCTYDYEAQNPGGFATNFIFVPGYSEDVAGDPVEPYGEWPARRVATTAAWKNSGNIRFDIGAAVVHADATGRRLQDVVDAPGIGFNQPRDQVLQAFGYPVSDTDENLLPLQPAFTGAREFRCTGPPVATDYPYPGDGPATSGIECDMTPGSSGGGWMAGGDLPVLVSLTSYGYNDEPDRLYGPYIGKGAKVLYRAASGARKKPKK
jgi:hypothetical protein